MALTSIPASLSATALTLTTAAQPNITSVGTLTGLAVSGNIAGTLTTAAQTNITSVGTLTALTVSGITDTVNFKVSGAQGSDGQVLTSTGSGVGWENIPAGGVNGIGTSTTTQIITLSSGNKVGIGENVGNASATLHVYSGHSDMFKVQSTGNYGMLMNNYGWLAIQHFSPTTALDITWDNNTAYNATTSNTQREKGGILVSNTNNNTNTIAGIALSTGSWPNFGLWEIFALRQADKNSDLVFTGRKTNGDLAERLRIESDTGNVGIGTNGPTGKLHVYSGDAGTVAASTQADDLVVENNAEGGMTIITPDDQSARIRFTSPSTNNDVGGAHIFYRQNINKMSIGTTVSGGKMAILSGAGNETLILDANGALQLGGTTNSGFVDFDSTSLQLNTQRNPNTGGFVNTGRSHAGIALVGASGGSHIRFFTANQNNAVGTERLKIDKDGVAHFNGDVKVLSGDVQMGSGRGINFTASSNVGGMISETLDDYEEGTWTPGDTFQNSTNESNSSLNSSAGRYTKIGNVVTFSCVLNINTPQNLATDNYQVTGLPFASENVTNINYIFTPSMSNVSTDTPLIFFLQPNQNVMFLSNNNGAGNGGSLMTSGSNRLIRISGSYRTAS